MRIPNILFFIAIGALPLAAWGVRISSPEPALGAWLIEQALGNRGPALNHRYGAMTPEDLKALLEELQIAIDGLWARESERMLAHGLGILEILPIGARRRRSDDPVFYCREVIPLGSGLKIIRTVAPTRGDPHFEHLWALHDEWASVRAELLARKERPAKSHKRMPTNQPEG